jgi:hypothetical protein
MFALAFYGILLFGIAFGLSAMARGKIQLTRRKVIEGNLARVAGCLAAIAVIALFVFFAIVMEHLD